ncbi:hypothetical protein PoB_005054800 [Plakobranchus ocellatus]|uniref:Uncharacterized protein n=1 Tax=Plakobranchus ocellatus TaxID=259542 RepID=A0AAV4BZ29_9GAST|nr:hypothetical protein PoB_005054800 [Plakobranchus ocellatus]
MVTDDDHEDDNDDDDNEDDEDEYVEDHLRQKLITRASLRKSQCHSRTSGRFARQLSITKDFSHQKGWGTLKIRLGNSKDKVGEL